jgi:hypothetical protein
MYSNLFGLIALCENVIYSRKANDEDIELAKTIKHKLLGNYKLTTKEKKFLGKL